MFLQHWRRGLRCGGRRGTTPYAAEIRSRSLFGGCPPEACSAPASDWETRVTCPQDIQTSFLRLSVKNWVLSAFSWSALCTPSLQHGDFASLAMPPAITASFLPRA